MDTHSRAPGDEPGPAPLPTSAVHASLEGP